MSNPSSYVELLDRGIVAKRKAEPKRGHLGYSSIGDEDERRLWLEFRWCMPEIEDPRILRIFDNGNLVEDLLAKWTKEAGIRLETTGPDGHQFRFSRFGGHLGGSMDGAVFSLPEFDQEWGVWEAKSANDNRFKALKKLDDGSYVRMAWDDLQTVGIRAWSPRYWGQVTCYMGESGMQHAVIPVYDKNRSEVHPVFLEADEMAFQTLISKAERIIECGSIPAPAYPTASDFRCKIMMNDEERLIYWGERLPVTANCRNCRFSAPITEGEGARWQCHYHDRLCGTIKHQQAGCEMHQFIPELMPARLDPSPDNDMASKDAVMYITHEGEPFTNGPGGFSSDELIELAKDEFRMMSDGFFQQAREELGATVMTQQQLADLGYVDEDIPF